MMKSRVRRALKPRSDTSTHNAASTTRTMLENWLEAVSCFDCKKNVFTSSPPPLGSEHMSAFTCKHSARREFEMGKVGHFQRINSPHTHNLPRRAVNEFQLRRFPRERSQFHVESRREQRSNSQLSRQALQSLTNTVARRNLWRTRSGRKSSYSSLRRLLIAA